MHFLAIFVIFHVLLHLGINFWLIIALIAGWWFLFRSVRGRMYREAIMNRRYTRKRDWSR